MARRVTAPPARHVAAGCSRTVSCCVFTITQLQAGWVAVTITARLTGTYPGAFSWSWYVFAAPGMWHWVIAATWQGIVCGGLPPTITVTVSAGTRSALKARTLKGQSPPALRREVWRKYRRTQTRRGTR